MPNDRMQRGGRHQSLSEGSGKAPPLNGAARRSWVVRHSVAAVYLIMLTACLSACGYSATETFPQDYATINVPIFENRTFYKGVEVDLAEALTKQITSRTPYRIASPGAADTMLQGTITRIDQFRVARSRDTSLPEQMEVRVTIDFVWKDLQTGEDILDRFDFAAVGRYIPTTPIGEPFQVAQHDAVNSLAQDIVDQMRGDW